MEMDGEDDQVQPVYQTGSMEDVAEILRRASNFAAETHKGEVVAAELREAAAFVEQEELDDE
jgi:hypothetical protein